MTLSYERENAVYVAQQLLYDLLNPKATPGVPRAVRMAARRVLKHYPGTQYGLKDLAEHITACGAQDGYQPIQREAPIPEYEDRKKEREQRACDQHTELWADEFARAIPSDFSSD